MIAMRINGIDVPLWEYERGLEDYLKTVDAPATDTAATRAYRDGLIDQLLVESYAERNGTIRDPEFRRRLNVLRRQLIYDFVLERDVLDSIEITTESIREYYESHRERFTEPRKIQVRHIVTRSSTSTEQARKRIEAGEDFAKVAAEVSIHPSAAQGGQMPLFSPGTYQPAFEKAAMALEVGELSPVIETELGFHLIEKTAEKPARVKPLSEVQAEIRKILYEAECKRRIDRFLESLRREVRVELPGENNPVP
jgi:parvulin-like peptidyl-prolyl isomerase